MKIYYSTWEGGPDDCVFVRFRHFTQNIVYQIGSEFGCLLAFYHLHTFRPIFCTSPWFSCLVCVRMCSTFNYPVQICVHISVWFLPSSSLESFAFRHNSLDVETMRFGHAWPLPYYIKTFTRIKCDRESLIEYVLFLWMQPITLDPSPTSFIFDSINGHLRRIEKLTSGMGKLQFVMFSLWILISYQRSCAHHSLIISILNFSVADMRCQLPDPRL